jgi:hypothetical protein
MQADKEAADKQRRLHEAFTVTIDALIKPEEHPINLKFYRGNVRKHMEEARSLGDHFAVRQDQRLIDAINERLAVIDPPPTPESLREQYEDVMEFMNAPRSIGEAAALFGEYESASDRAQQIADDYRELTGEEIWD